MSRIDWACTQPHVAGLDEKARLQTLTAQTTATIQELSLQQGQSWVPCTYYLIQCSYHSPETAIHRLFKGNDAIPKIISLTAVLFWIFVSKAFPQILDEANIWLQEFRVFTKSFHSFSFFLFFFVYSHCVSSHYHVWICNTTTDLELFSCISTACLFSTSNPTLWILQSFLEIPGGPFRWEDMVCGQTALICWVPSQQLWQSDNKWAQGIFSTHS